MGKLLSICSLHRSLLFLFGRIIVYAVLLGAIAVGMLWGAVVYDAAFYDELGPIEILETVLALLSAVVFLWAARLDSIRTTCSVLLTGLLFCVAVRESDYFLDVLVGRHSWKVIVSVIVIGMILYAIANRKDLYRSILVFINRPCFGVFMSGFLVLVVFSRLFGYGGFWEAILDSSSYRTVKTIVEEGVELMGYFLILISSVEYLHDAWMRNRYPDLPADLIDS